MASVVCPLRSIIRLPNASRRIGSTFTRQVEMMSSSGTWHLPLVLFLSSVSELQFNVYVICTAAATFEAPGACRPNWGRTSPAIHPRSINSPPSIMQIKRTVVCRGSAAFVPNQRLPSLRKICARCMEMRDISIKMHWRRVPYLRGSSLPSALHARPLHAAVNHAGSLAHGTYFDLSPRSFTWALGAFVSNFTISD